MTWGPRRVVLVGAGHAHLQVLEAWGGRPLGDVELTVVVDREKSIYSGMVPGLLGGDYTRDELTVPIGPLVRAAGGTLVVSPLISVDPQGRRLFLADGRRVQYELASLNLGSTVAGRSVPGVAEYAVPTRPLASLLDAMERVRVEGGGGPVAVVGGGAAGVELAAALAAALGVSASGPGAPRGVTLLEAGPRLLPQGAEAVSRRVRGELERRGVAVRTEAVVEAVEARSVRLADGSELPARLTVWATGAAPPEPLVASPLPTDDDGFVRVRPTLQVVGHPDLFAVGDCASVEGRDLPRAGVHAVRQGPLLRDNLEARLRGGRLRRYRRGADALALLNLGDGRALAVRWGVAVSGRWVMWLKDRIDRRWVDRFRL